MAKKTPTKAEREYMGKVADLGCIVCRHNGWYGVHAELHHIRTGQGMSQRASNYDVIPLCPNHHRNGGYGVAIHAGKKGFEKNFGSELKLLEEVKKLISPN